MLIRPSRRSLLAGLALAGGGLLAGRAGAVDRPACGPAARDALGPFYVSGTPETTNLNTAGLPGVPIRIEGRVFGGPERRRALADATVEVWHADGGGRYHPQGNGPADRFDASAITLRGTVPTGPDGWYAFVSILPGHYGSRARHFHYRVTAPGHQPLVTQIYFADDPALARDWLAADSAECQRLAVEEKDGLLIGLVDLELAPA